MKNIIILFTLLMALNIGLNAQIYPIPLSQRIDQSQYIFEGVVLESESYWGPDERMIYTAHRVQLLTSFKGDISGDEVEIITRGGANG